MAEQYIEAFKKLAKTSNTMILPSNPGDVSAFLAQAMGVYNHLSKQTVESLPQSVENCVTTKAEYKPFHEEKTAVKINIE